jgi:hypothetical protein
MGLEGGAICNLGNLTVKNTNFITNFIDKDEGRMESRGGAISCIGPCNIDGSTFLSNIADKVSQDMELSERVSHTEMLTGRSYCSLRRP